jgi:cytochrome c oxidase accessory protein FixG
MSFKDLPEERPSTFDETGRRVYLYPAAVKGFFRTRRNWVQGFLILFFLLLPWIHWNGQQILFLNVAEREFFLFGLHFRAHDAPYLLFLFLTFAFAIALVTAVMGRAWCGWACPQTVFIEGVYRRIENWIEGNHRERRARDQGPWTAEKVRLKGFKFFVFLIVSLVITNSFLAYFVGSKPLLSMITSSPLEAWPSFLFILFSTAIIFINFGWFREQFCMIVCPYGRFQSVLLDKNSLVVAYDYNRGEPRKGMVAAVPQGDCVSCYRCVQVCPTGVDIRRGLQLECIHCTACVDACDDVMATIGKPLGLIRYTSESELEGKKRTVLRPRVAAYTLALVGAISALTFFLSQKEFLQIAVLRAKDFPYQVIGSPKGELVINHFRLDISNQTRSATSLTLSSSENGLELVMPMSPLNLPDGAHTRADFFLRFPATLLVQGERKVQLMAQSPEGIQTLEVTLVGPNNK